MLNGKPNCNKYVCLFVYLFNFSPATIWHIHPSNIDSDDLVLEVRAAYHAFPDHLSTPIEMLDYIYKEQLLDLYGNLSIAFRLLLTLPITVASGERSFSALKLIKTYLRSTMSQERLSGLALMSIEHRVRRSLNLDDIINAFAQAKSRKHPFWKCVQHLFAVHMYCFIIVSKFWLALFSTLHCLEQL